MTKYVFCSDIHFRDDPPHCYRSMSRDEWHDYQLGIFEEVLNVAMENKAKVCIAGDVFNTDVVSIPLLSKIIRLVNHYFDMNITACYGQHDLKNHDLSNKEGTALDHLFLVNTFQEYFSDLCYYPWGCELKEGDGICLAHKTVWIKPPFPGADSSGNVKYFDDYGYDLMVFGDNHQPFQVRVDKTLILNCGSLVKQALSETHKPACYIYDGENIQTVYVTCREFDEEEYSISENTSIIEGTSCPDGHLSFRKNVEFLARNVKPFIAKKASNIVDRSES